MCKRKHFSSNDHNKRKMIRSNEHKIRISINSNNLKTRLIFRQKYHLIRIILMSNERKKRKAFCRNRRNISLIPRQNVLFVEFFSGERTFMQSAILALLTLPDFRAFFKKLLNLTLFSRITTRMLFLILNLTFF